MGMFFPDYGVFADRSGSQKLSVVGVAAAHIVVLGLLALTVPTERLMESARPIAVRLIELAPETPVPETPAPPRPVPPPPRPMPATPPPAPVPPPVMAVTSPAVAPAPIAAPLPEAAAVTPPPLPQASTPAVVPAPVSAPVPAPEPPLVSARFNADYLQNPKPVYPRISRRRGEQGKVVLRVFVSADGSPGKIELRTGSGYQRLDQAAREAVTHWRFVPAKRGEQAVSAWVVVPIVFSLNSES
jgi:protein TonB